MATFNVCWPTEWISERAPHGSPSRKCNIYAQACRSVVVVAEASVQKNMCCMFLGAPAMTVMMMMMIANKGTGRELGRGAFLKNTTAPVSGWLTHGTHYEPARCHYKILHFVRCVYRLSLHNPFRSTLSLYSLSLSICLVGHLCYPFNCCDGCCNWILPFIVTYCCTQNINTITHYTDTIHIFLGWHTKYYIGFKWSFLLLLLVILRLNLFTYLHACTEKDNKYKQNNSIAKRICDQRR